MIKRAIRRLATKRGHWKEGNGVLVLEKLLLCAYSLVVFLGEYFNVVGDKKLTDTVALFVRLSISPSRAIKSNNKRRHFT